jgi:hypothetical protein
MAVAGVQQTPPMCDFTRIWRQKIINYINKLVSVLEMISEAAGKCCISTSVGNSVAAIVPFFERDCACSGGRSQLRAGAIGPPVRIETAAGVRDQRRRPARQNR